MIERCLLYGALAVSIIGAMVGYGYYLGVQQLWEYQAKQAAAAVVVIRKIEKVKETVRVVHVKREVEIREVFVPIEREVASVPSRAACNITLGWLHLHNAAASGSGRHEGRVDDPSDSGVTEAQSAATVAANYKAFHQVANDLTTCRAFVSGLKEATAQNR